MYLYLLLFLIVIILNIYFDFISIPEPLHKSTELQPVHLVDQ
jgi:hypothetical protein